MGDVDGPATVENAQMLNDLINRYDGQKSKWREF